MLGEDVNRLSLIALDFPKFRDGRAFSWARMLRTRLGFTGEIRAVGDFLYDQINYQHRVGFDAWEVPDHFTIEIFNRALAEMTNVYQPSTDGKKTIRRIARWALRFRPFIPGSYRLRLIQCCAEPAPARLCPDIDRRFEKGISHAQSPSAHDRFAGSLRRGDGSR